MFREQYQQLHAQIGPDQELMRTVITKAGKWEKKKVSRILFLRKPVIGLAALCICIYMAMPVLASSSESVYRMMYLLSPGIAQHFMPVQKTDEDNGIKMEVISAYIHDSTAEIYITMQDMEGDRIDETTDLFDSYSINRPFDSTCHCEFAGYEKSTKTASFLIKIDEWGGKDISGEKITFSVGNFLSHKKEYENMQIPVDLSAVSEAGNTQTVSLTGASSKDEQKVSELFEQNPNALVPSAPVQEFAADGMDLTGIGYIDGKLHIQTAVTDPLSRDNHGQFYLEDKKGERTGSEYAFSFTNGAQMEERVDYHEEVFDIPQDELEDYVLCGDFSISGLLTEGNWRVTFPLEEKSE